MINKNIEQIIIKFLNRSLNSKELDYLKEWILNPKNESLFEDYIKSHFEITIGMNSPDVEDIKEKLFHEIRKDKSLIYTIKSNPFYRLGVAAIIVLLFSLPFIIKKSSPDIENTTIIVQENIEPGSDKAILTLADGSIVALEKGTAFQKNNIKSNGEGLVYKDTNTKKESITYNYLTIPRGGEWLIKLSDGTQVWLNSESQLKYPTDFIKGENRIVELVYGEAYFDVSSSENHNDSKFIVHNQNQDIEVLGTEFNIKAYKEETNIYTTLVEGRVLINQEGEKQNLLPDQQSVLDKNTNSIVVTNVNVYNEISWKDGVYSFDGKTLREVMKVMSRWYDMEVVFKNKDIEDEEFVGVLRRNRDIKTILSSIKGSGAIKDYTVNGKNVILE